VSARRRLARSRLRRRELRSLGQSLLRWTRKLLRVGRIESLIDLGLLSSQSRINTLVCLCVAKSSNRKWGIYFSGTSEERPTSSICPVLESHLIHVKENEIRRRLSPR
jgi:hypothetical protein